MHKSKFMEKLLDGVKVEWKKLGDVAEIGTGRSNRKDENENGKYPFYVRSKNILKSNKFQFDETAIVIPGEGGIGDIFHYVEGKYALHQRAYRIKINVNNLNTKFLYYFMYSSFKQYILSKSVGATSISIRKPMLEKFKIPIPPLEIQSEIVKILDNFTELTAELTAELSARKKQYSYYRDKLLDFSNKDLGFRVEWKKLGEVLTRTRGTKITASKMKELHKDNAPIKIFAGGKTVAFVDFSDIPQKDINTKPSIIVKSRGIIEFEYYDKPFSHKNEMWSYYSDNENIDIKFIYYYLKIKEQYFQRIASVMQMPQISIQNTETYPIPIPPIEKQKEIVEILDKFDTLTNSISEGLPKEIELRTKQYEYYRDMLLSFSKEKIEE